MHTFLVSFRTFAVNLLFAGIYLTWYVLNLKLERDYSELSQDYFTLQKISSAHEYFSTLPLESLINMKPKRFKRYSPWAILYCIRITSTLISNFQIILLTFSSEHSESIFTSGLSKHSHLKFNAVSVFTSWILLIHVFSDYNEGLMKFETFIKNLWKLGFDCLREILPFFFAYLFAGMAIFAHSKRFAGYYDSQ
jgi:hypothetical protein